MLGLMAVCLAFVVGTLQILFEATSPLPPADTATPTRPNINIPSVEYPTIPPSAPSYTVNIQSVDQSGVTGRVTFKDVAGEVAILLHLDGIDEEDLVPVKLQHGSCAERGPLAYELVSPDAGESETDLTIKLEEFNKQKPLAIVIYRSAQDHTTIACGDIK